MKKYQKFGLTAYPIIVLVIMLIPITRSFAEYTIGIDDVLQIAFWQKPELNQTVSVNSDGKITLTVIGELTAAGLTPTNLARKIVEQVSRFDRDISQATVTVATFNSQTVFVQGEVVTPGRYSREVIPDLWTIIKEMGGINEVGDLRNVKIIRGGTVDPGKILTVDVESAVSNRDFSVLPKIYPHDIIQVPRTISGLPTTGIPAQAVTVKNIYYVVGAINKPQPYNYEPGIDLLQAITYAGGTAPGADLEHVHISSKSGDYANVYTVNLEKQMKEGSPQRYLLQPEDVIVIPLSKVGTGSVILGVLRDVATFGGTITSAILLIDRLNHP